MFDRTRRTVLSFVAVYSLLHVNGVNAVKLGTFGNSIFQFQQKMAARGNTSAEYKLGTLYEFGVSVKPSVADANIYYQRAAKKGYKPAINRLTYLEIKKSGYLKAKHDPWFKNLTSQANASEPNALILLGQMHRHGINTEKNLNKSLAMLQKASSLGHTEVESEIDEIFRELEAKSELREKVTEPVKEVVKVEKPKKVKKVAKAPNPSPAKKQKSKKSELKRRKYEEAMRKLYQERLIMQQQQEWSENEE